MQTFLHKIYSALVSIAIGASSLLPGATDVNQHLPSAGSIIPTPVAQFQTSLASSILALDTSMTLVSAVDKDGNTLASSTYGFVIDEGTGLDEFVLANCTGTVCTGLTRGVSVLSGTTSVTSLKRPHRRGASVKITDAPLLLVLTRIANGQDTFPNVLSYASNFTFSTTSNQIPSANYIFTNYFNLSGGNIANGTNTFNGTSTLVNGALTSYLCDQNSPLNQLCDKAYINAVATSGAPNASSIQKGVVEEATLAEADAGTSVGGTGAQLYLNPAVLASSTLLSSNFATTTSVFPLPPMVTTGLNDQQHASTTTMFVGLVTIPSRIVARKITVKIGSVVTPGRMQVGLYNSYGNLLFAATTSLLSAATTTTLTLSSPVTLNAGNYYIGNVLNGGGNISPTAFDGDDTYYNTLNSILGSAGAGYNNISGTTSVASGTVPTSFNPSTLGAFELSTLISRIDN